MPPLGEFRPLVLLHGSLLAVRKWLGLGIKYSYISGSRGDNINNVNNVLMYADSKKVL